MKLCFLNACSMNRHLEDIRCDNSIMAADIACFSETIFFNRDSQDDTSLPGFLQYRQDSHSLETTMMERVVMDFFYNSPIVFCLVLLCAFTF